MQQNEAQPIRINNVINDRVLYPGTTTPYYLQDPNATGYYGVYPFNSKFQFDGQMFQKFCYTSVVSCRYNDMFFNSGSLNVDDSGTKFIFQLKRLPLNFDDLVVMLSDNTFKDTTNTIVLNTIFQFVVIDDSKGITDTRLQMVNVDASTHTIDAEGNMQGFLGLWSTLSLEAFEEVKLSDDNTLRINYIVLRSADINGEFQCQKTNLVGNDFDKSVICIADYNTTFQYANKNLDVHMKINNQTPCRFEIVDQTGREVNITYCFLEMLMYPEGFFEKNKIQRILKNGLKHNKEQQHILLKPTSQNFQFSRSFKELSISDVQGQIFETSDYFNKYAIYCSQISQQYPIAVVIVTSDMVLQPQSRDIFLWDQVVGSGASQLNFIVKKYSKDLLTQTVVTDYPEMVIRLLMK